MDKEHMKTNKFKEDEKRTSQKKKKHLKIALCNKVYL